MSIMLPNLDDRRYADLVEEAHGLLVACAPALTNHNPSDPAVTLLELFAYFTDVLLFRVNNVTDANRLKFLQLLNGRDWPNPDLHEDRDAQVRSTVLALRRPDRAVTAEDFEFLACAADAEGVARAHCIPERNLDTVDPTQRQQRQPGHVSVVIVPSPTADPERLRKTVAEYLEPRRLLTARLHVVSPRFIPLRIRLTLRLLRNAPERQVKETAVDALRRFFDPIAGRGGNGWPFGRSVYLSEVYSLLDKLPGVDFARRTSDPDTSASLDELLVPPDFAGRLMRNPIGELIGVAVEDGELIDIQILTRRDSDDRVIDVNSDLIIEQPPLVS